MTLPLVSVQVAPGTMTAARTNGATRASVAIAALHMAEAEAIQDYGDSSLRGFIYRLSTLVACG
jgi:hypothetical protein